MLHLSIHICNWSCGVIISVCLSLGTPFPTNDVFLPCKFCSWYNISHITTSNVGEEYCAISSICKIDYCRFMNMVLKLGRTCGHWHFSSSSPLPPPPNKITRAFLSSLSLDTQLKEGVILRKQRVFTHAEVLKYSQLSQDSNPIHLNSVQAREAGFKDTVVHGMLYAALFPSIIASHFSEVCNQMLLQGRNASRP